MDAFDVGVIGAGIHGAAAAFHLTSRGAKTVVFERGAPAGGPTGRSSAICRAYYTNEFLAKMARDSIAMFRDFRELTGRDAGHRRTGVLYLHPPEHAGEVRASVARLNELGIATDLLEPEELAERFPAFDLGGIGIGAWEREAGYADPHAATDGLFRRALELGAEARVGTPVTGIEPDPEGGGTVTTGDGARISCRRILIAAGPWTRPLAQMAGADLPLHVERHVVATFRWGSAEPVPAHGDLVGGYYLRPEGSEQYLVGTLHAADRVDPDDFAQGIRPDEIEALGALVVKRVPGLERSEVQGGWASLYDVSPDWQPVIGEIAPGIFVDAGTSGHGFKLAPALGREVASMVMGDRTDPGLADFHPIRFEQGRSLQAGFGEARILG